MFSRREPSPASEKRRLEKGVPMPDEKNRKDYSSGGFVEGEQKEALLTTIEPHPISAMVVKSKPSLTTVYNAARGIQESAALSAVIGVALQVQEIDSETNVFRVFRKHCSVYRWIFSIWEAPGGDINNKRSNLSSMSHPLLV